MNPLENYKALVEKYFGSGTATFATTSGATNNLIGALNHATEFSTFRFVFGKRMERLAAQYPPSDLNRNKLLERVNAVAAREWDGAYAELVAYDFGSVRNPSEAFRIVRNGSECCGIFPHVAELCRILRHRAGLVVVVFVHEGF